MAMLKSPTGPQPRIATVLPARSCVAVAKTALPNGSWRLAISGGSFVRSFCQITDAGHDHVLGEGAVAVDAEDLRLLAHVRLAGAAVEADAAGDVALGRDVVARRDVADVAPDLDDGAGELVAERERRLNAVRGPVVQRKMCRSVPQRLAASTRMRTSSSPAREPASRRARARDRLQACGSPTSSRPLGFEYDDLAKRTPKPPS